MTKVFTVANEEDADIKACEVYTFFDADLVVFKTATAEAATGNGLWYMADSPEDAVKIFWLKNDNGADVRVFFAPAEFEAGWKPDSAIQARFEGVL